MASGDNEHSAVIHDVRVTALPRARVTGWNFPLLAAATGAHFINDFYVAFLAPLLPLVVTRFDLSLTLAGFLATILTTSSAMSQPVFGLFADRMSRRFFVVLGPALTALAMGMMGLAPSYGSLIVLLLIAGTGTATFHPQGASTAGVASGNRKGVGLSLFVAGGELGYALGPVVIALAVASSGLNVTWLVALPGLALCALLWKQLAAQTVVHAERPKSLRADLRSVWRPLALLWTVVVLRSIIISAFITFLPLLLRERGGSIVAGGAAVFLFGGVGAVGGLVGGTLSDRLGRRAMLTISLLLGTPLLFLFLQTQGAWSYIALASGGITFYLSAAITIVMAQEALPHRASVASSIVMGLAWGVAGLALTGVGALADAVGLASALTAVLGLALVALVFVGFLPKAGNTVTR
jgi:FSR family fosmidomycin resistance protein-like MFS transporter